MEYSEILYATDAEMPVEKDVSSIWNPTLTHQLRVLLHTDRLLSLQHRDEHRPTDFKHYTSLSLALKVFDLIIAHTGLGLEIDHNQAINELLPLLETMDRSAGIIPDRERQIQMAERVLSTLLNESDGQKPFKLPYTIFEEGKAIQRVLSVRLIEERHHLDGRVILRLSNESANLLLNALTVDLEDSQAAAEAIIQSQLARGRLQDARISAQWALQQSMRLREHIERHLLNTRRDIESVDWNNDMMHIIDEALVHIQNRCTMENSIVATAREQREQLDPGNEKGYQLTEIISLVEACRQQHLILQRSLMEAPRIFLEEQERQILTFHPTTVFPNPLKDLLNPLLNLPRAKVLQTVDTIMAACLPPRPPTIFSLARYLHYLLQPRREMHTDTVPIMELDLLDTDSEQSFFNTDVFNIASRYLFTLESPQSLSSLVQEAQNAEESITIIQALVFIVMEYFDPKDTQKQNQIPIDVFKAKIQQFRLINIAGDDVVIAPRKDIHAP